MKKLILALAAAVFSVLAAPALASNCSPFPYTLSNGTTADAPQVMADLNLLMACANNSLAHNGVNTDITSLNSVMGLTNSQLSAMPAGTVKGNASGGSGAPSDLTGAQVEALVQPSLPFELYAFVGGLTGNAWNLAAYQPSTSLVLTTSASHCAYGTAATGSTTYTLKDNGSSIGTVVYTNIGCTITVTSSPHTVPAGHTLSISGPATGDTTLADIGMTFGGTRN